MNTRVKFLSRNSEVFKIYTNFLSCLVENQVYNMFVCTLCPCLTSFPTMKLRHANYNEIPACSTCHVPRERAVPHLIALRKHDRPRHSDFFGVVKKKIHFYFTCCRYAIWMNRQSEFVLFCFFFIVQFYQTCRIPDETKKNLGPKISPQNFQALISTSPEIFPWRINVRISKCLWLVCLSYHRLNYCGASIVRVRYLNQATKNVDRYI